MGEKIVVIGSGFAGISAATHLAFKGYDVTILEKNSTPGGRASVFREAGFTFDMGPSWYWMPDVFDRYFEYFGKNTSDFYMLKRLDPSYAVIFGDKDCMQVPAKLEALKTTFEDLEPGSGAKLDAFLKQAAYKYEVGINDLVYKPCRSIFEFADLRLLSGIIRLDVFQSIHKHIRKFFKHEKIIQLMEFPILFLGALPENTPALYSLMNYADICLGTWYPMGGMHKIIEGMVKLAEMQGVKFQYEAEVTHIEVVDGRAKKVHIEGGFIEADTVVGAADYHHIETRLLDPKFRSYSDKYWDTRVMAPSSLIFYLGVNKKLSNLLHHNLFFDTDFKPHAIEIYENPKWPENPLFYVSATSVTDPDVAPENCENLFILIPVAPDLEDKDEIREKYYHIVMDRLEKLTKQKIREHVIFKRSYAHRDFKTDYHAFKGNAYGLANTLMQTAILKPGLKSKKIDNMYYCGQLTVPGPGVPPSLISGHVVAEEVHKSLSKIINEPQAIQN